MSVRRRGLALGKFAPFHRGHQLLIERGLAETDEMVVLVYDAPEVTEIPLSVRAGWIRSLYPAVQIIEAWDGPSEVGYTEEIMAAHESYVRERLADHKIDRVTHFFSSEPYGEHMSRALQAVDRRVDAARRDVPISGRDVRRDPYAHRGFLSPVVYRDLITNVVLLGAPSTGKTTLACHLAALFDTQWMPEYGREYWELHQIDRRLSPEQLVEIAEEHARREEALREAARHYLFSDTNALTTATFARYYHGQVAPRLEALVDGAIRRADLLLVCDTDIPYEATWDRSGDVNRAAFQRQILADLAVRKLPYFMVRGSMDRRTAQVREILSRFRKFGNPLEWAQSGRNDQAPQR